jgi:PAS domain S-box-containing protein
MKIEARMHNLQFVSNTCLIYGASFLLIYLIEFLHERLGGREKGRDLLGAFLLGLAALAVQLLIRGARHPALAADLPDGGFLLIFISILFYGTGGGSITMLMICAAGLALGHRPPAFLLANALIACLGGLASRSLMRGVGPRYHLAAAVLGTALIQLASLGAAALLLTPPGARQDYVSSFPLLFPVLEIYALSISLIFVNNRAIGRKLGALKDAEDALRHRTAFLETLLNSSTDGILVVDGQGKKILQNRQMAEIWNIPRAIAEDEDDTNQVRYVMTAVTDPEEFATKVSWLYDHPGESSRDEISLKVGKVLDRYSTPAIGENGQHYGRIWIFHEITELRAGERRLWSLFEDSPIAIWEEDFSAVRRRLFEAGGEGSRGPEALLGEPGYVNELSALVRVLNINRAAIELLGYSDKAALLASGRAFIDNEELIEAFRRELIALLDGQRTFEGEAIIVTAQGERIFGLLKLSVMPGYEETWEHVIVSIVNVSERVRTSQALKQSLTEKETLLREIHHRVKNNLQIICSLISMQRNSGKISPEGDRTLVDLESRVRTMAIVHEMLYQVNDYASVDFSAYVGQLCNYLLEAYAVSPGQIHIEVSVESFHLALEKAIPCGILLNELLVNALKYAFPDGRSGTIKVGLARGTGDRMVLTVSDDGIGAAKADLDHGKQGSFGLSLVGSMAEQLGGRSSIDSSAGVTVSVDIPIL